MIFETRSIPTAPNTPEEARAALCAVAYTDIEDAVYSAIGALVALGGPAAIVRLVTNLQHALDADAARTATLAATTKGAAAS